MISAQTALFMSDNKGMPSDVNDWLDERIKARCEKGKHHLVLTEKDVNIIQDEFEILPADLANFCRKAGYKVSYDNFDKSFIIRWND